MNIELERRIEDLEKQLSEIKKLNGIPGPAVNIIELEGRVQYLENLVRELRSIPAPTRGETGTRGPKGDTGEVGATGAAGAVGPRGDPGKPGNVDAAVANAERVLDEKLASLFKRVDDYNDAHSAIYRESSDSLRRELDQFRAEMRQSFSDFQAQDKNRVENCIVQVLSGYGVVSSHDNKPIVAD
jgi:hypothetical protein